MFSFPSGDQGEWCPVFKFNLFPFRMPGERLADFFFYFPSRCQGYFLAPIAERAFLVCFYILFGMFGYSDGFRGTLITPPANYKHWSDSLLCYALFHPREVYMPSLTKEHQGEREANLYLYRRTYSARNSPICVEFTASVRRTN